MTYQVGPNRPFTSLNALSNALSPGDVVEVDGDTTYPGGIVMQSSGRPQSPVIIRGMSINGKRPVLSGGSQTIVFYQDHVVFENFEVTGGTASCIINKGHDITLRSVLVHDCAAHGILGTDMYAGSQTLEFVEVHGTGQGQYKHQIYLATDNTMHPDAVVRIQHSYIHDAAGGHNIKSRASRNEIYENWISEPGLHVLDLIGADGQDADLAREDSDVVGNVLVQAGSYAIARIGGDGTGASSGRYRFAYNTIVMSPSQGDAFRLQDQIESLALVNNVFVAPDGGSPTLVEMNGPIWTSGTAQLYGQSNFVQSGLSPASFFMNTIAVGDAGFVDFADDDLSPAPGSPLVDAGLVEAGPTGHTIPSPLVVPTFVPDRYGTDPHPIPTMRSFDGAPDVGAFEQGDGSATTGAGGSDPGGGGAGGAAGVGGSDPGSGGGAPGVGGSDAGNGGAGGGTNVSTTGSTGSTSGAGPGHGASSGAGGPGDTPGGVQGQCAYAPGPADSCSWVSAAALLAALGRLVVARPRRSRAGAARGDLLSGSGRAGSAPRRGSCDDPWAG